MTAPTLVSGVMNWVYTMILLSLKNRRHCLAFADKYNLPFAKELQKFWLHRTDFELWIKKLLFITGANRISLLRGRIQNYPEFVHHSLKYHDFFIKFITSESWFFIYLIAKYYCFNETSNMTKKSETSILFLKQMFSGCIRFFPQTFGLENTLTTF
jgi:hypothetical protein